MHPSILEDHHLARLAPARLALSGLPPNIHTQSITAFVVDQYEISGLAWSKKSYHLLLYHIYDFY
ncbi:MAG: hypothetical protein QE493_02680 [Verrucomicrobiae bacterium]|jgi:hypothetical protein|nr:hypothetical protein [Verrucomicrobiae bacterium]